MKLRKNSYRLKDYDYAQAGGYFVTLCTHERRHLFGVVERGVMYLNPLGEIARAEWGKAAQVRTGVEVDMFVVMPNHIHGVLIFEGNQNQGKASDRAVRQRGELGSLVAAYKAAVTRQARALVGILGEAIWQRNYYDHVIRSTEDYERICEYIVNNPLAWEAGEDLYAGEGGAA